MVSSDIIREEVFLEKEVIEVTKKYLQANGYTIIYEGKRRGPDLVAYNSVKNELLIIEVRGVPTRVKIRGRDKGKPKKKSTIANQFWGWPAKVLVELMEREYEWIHKSVHWVTEVIEKVDVHKSAVKYVGVFGYDKRYLDVLEKRKYALSRLGYEFWLIDKESNVRHRYT